MMAQADARPRMPLVPALKTLADLRSDEIAVTSMGSAREWPKLSQHPLDFQYLPSAMGQAPLLGLGLALAQPRRRVIVFSGDGSLLMNLGCLVTIASSRAANYTLVVLDNRIYEVTGGQRTAAAVSTNFAAMASAAGFASTASFGELDAWQRRAAETLRLPGPRFISLRVEPIGADYQLPPPAPMAERIRRFRQALGT